MAKVNHFEIPIEHPQAMIPFYTDVFDWKIDEWQEGSSYWLTDGGSVNEYGINGALTLRENPAQAITIYIGVEDIELTLQKALQRGAEILQPVAEIPGIGLHAYLKDPDGNRIGVIQPSMERPE